MPAPIAGPSTITRSDARKPVPCKEFICGFVAGLAIVSIEATACDASSDSFAWIVAMTVFLLFAIGMTVKPLAHLDEVRNMSG